jgi:YVTN family beta-propeller protein
MRRFLVVFSLSLALSLWCLAQQLPRNADKGDIVLGGVVSTPGDNPNDGFPDGLDPLPGALVVIEGTSQKTSTDRNGLFVFTEAPDGDVTLHVTHDGYQPLRLRARVDKTSLGEPPTLWAEMLPLGVSRTEKGLSGPGTLYATMAPRVETTAGSDGDFTNLLAVLALGVDPLSVAVERPPTASVGPEMAEIFPLTEHPCSVMVRPAQAPSRTSYLEMGSVPVWPCFDASGRYLYVSTVYQHRIEVFDVSRNHEYIQNIPLSNAFVSSLTLSRDGRYIYATQMGKTMGVLAIDTTTHLPAAFFELPDATMIPNALACSAQGLLYIALSNAVNPGGAGQLLALDPSTGAVLSTLPVGSTPTDVLLTPDGKTAITVNMGNASLSVLDLNSGSLLRTLTAEVSPNKAVLTTDGRLFVTNKGNGTVSVLSLADGSRLARVKVGKGPVDICLSADQSEAYVSNYQDGTISVLDVRLATVKATTPPNPRANPLGLAVRP